MREAFVSESERVDLAPVTGISIDPYGFKDYCVSVQCPHTHMGLQGV